MTLASMTPAVVIDRLTLIVSDLDRAEDDYVKTFRCTVEQRTDIESELTRVLCVAPARGRRSSLRLGRQRIELLEFCDSAGRAYPPDSTSTDLWFQHLAIVVDDMTAAYRRVMANRRFRPISRNGPVQLPASSGGVLAFKFRDHDGHPLELLAFPPGADPPEWRRPGGADCFLGIDHTAIAVGDVARSTRFFGSVFGFRVGTRTENRGPEQAALDDVEDVEVSVTRLGRICPRHGWNCCATTWARACRSHPAPPATTSWPRTVRCGSRRSTRWPGRWPARAHRWPATPAWSCVAAPAPPSSPDQTGIASWWKNGQAARGPSCGRP